MNNKAKFRRELSRRFLNDLLASPLGRAYVMSQAAAAENSDESVIFDRLIPVVDDPQLKKAIATHKADEERHAQMFEQCAERQGVGKINIPEHLQLLPIIREEIGNFDADIKTDEDIMNAYLVLQVIEERAVEQFSLVAEVLRQHDPQSAAVIAEIMKDEERHLRYCAAISKRYAPNMAILEKKLALYRDAEGRAFQKQQMLTTAHMWTMNAMPPAKTWMWRALLAVTVPLTRRTLPYTQAKFKATGVNGTSSTESASVAA
jgi:rubrerythrin